MKDLSFLICQNLLIPFWFINILIHKHFDCILCYHKVIQCRMAIFFRVGVEKTGFKQVSILCPHLCRLHSSYLLSIFLFFFKVWLYRSVVIPFEKYFDNSKHENWGRLFGSIPTLIVLSVSISRHITTSVCFYWQSHVKFFENISFSPFFRRENKQFSRCVGIVTATANINVGRVQLLDSFKL